jgi:hypothetical protein
VYESVFGGLLLGLDEGKEGSMSRKAAFWLGSGLMMLVLWGGVRAPAYVSIVPTLVSKGGGPMATTENIQMEVQGNTLVIRVDLSKAYGLSGSGKSVIIASTGGNVSVPSRDEVKIGLNVYRPQQR